MARHGLLPELHIPMPTMFSRSQAIRLLCSSVFIPVLVISNGYPDNPQRPRSRPLGCGMPKKKTFPGSRPALSHWTGSCPGSSRTSGHDWRLLSAGADGFDRDGGRLPGGRPVQRDRGRPAEGRTGAAAGPRPLGVVSAPLRGGGRGAGPVQWRALGRNRNVRRNPPHVSRPCSARGFRHGSVG